MLAGTGSEGWTRSNVFAGWKLDQKAGHGVQLLQEASLLDLRRGSLDKAGGLFWIENWLEDLSAEDCLEQRPEWRFKGFGI